MRIYFIGICGSAMGNVALSLSELGHMVAGSDSGMYPPMSDVLEAAKVELHTGFDAEGLLKWKPDCVVVGNAASRGNEQLELLLDERSIPMLSMPEAIGRFLLENRPRMVVAGTHGKTTTTCASAFSLAKLGCNPGYLLGGVPLDLPGGSALGAEGAPYVIEGDEYDSAIFDKRSKFQHYFPNVLLINNLEFDHGDIFLNEKDYFRTFKQLVRLIPRAGTLLLNADDSRCLELQNHAFCRVLKIGFSENADFRISDFRDSQTGSEFLLISPEGRSHLHRSRLNAEFNARNYAMSAIGVAQLLDRGDDWPMFLDALSEFRGVKRRMEIRFEHSDCIVFEDFGHHPTAIECSLQSLRARYPGHQVWAFFEPRSNTTVTNHFQDRLEKAFTFADRVHIAPVFRHERIDEGRRLDPSKIAEKCGPESCAWSDWAAMKEHVIGELFKKSEERILVFFSNGSFNGLITSVTDALKH